MILALKMLLEGIHLLISVSTFKLLYLINSLYLRIIMSADCLREVFGELDASSDTVQFTLAPDSPYFRITTFGTSGIYHVI